MLIPKQKADAESLNDPEVVRHEAIHGAKDVYGDGESGKGRKTSLRANLLLSPTG
jgi:hypothetical protein